MIGDGCCAFVSLSLGRKQPETARKSVGNSIIMVIVSGILLCAVYLIFSNQIIAMFGGTVNAETFRHSQKYFFYITLGIPFYMFGQSLNPIIRADGSPRFAMASTLAGAQYDFSPCFYLLIQMGNDGCGCCHRSWTGSDCCLFDYKDIQTIKSGGGKSCLTE